MPYLPRLLFLKARKQGLAVDYKAEYTDNAEKYAYYYDKGSKQVQVVYKYREGVGYCYIAHKTDGTEIIYYKELDGIIDYISKTIIEKPIVS